MIILCFNDEQYNHLRNEVKQFAKFIVIAEDDRHESFFVVKNMYNGDFSKLTMEQVLDVIRSKGESLTEEKLSAPNGNAFPPFRERT